MPPMVVNEPLMPNGGHPLPPVAPALPPTPVVSEFPPAARPSSISAPRLKRGHTRSDRSRPFSGGRAAKHATFPQSTQSTKSTKSGVLCPVSAFPQRAEKVFISVR
eukprot:GHVN01019140.1.p1 GENE.GHVN01019140.1~~GHVN01019140.1.p1  ORF type:complete len:106 (+),score=10.76 GHVN01019140.1:96-413(+)